MSERPVVTVLVPARDEASDIEACLEHVAAQDYPTELLEVIVVDGCSSDGTAELARLVLARTPFRNAVVLENPQATTPSNLNVGLAASTGDLVCRVDARTRIQPHYVRTCAAVLASQAGVATVGGAQVALARRETPVAIGIARALNNRWTMGGSRYRRASTSGASDTVYLGAFRRRELVELGGWDERLPSNQDFDLNRRMAACGTVWFEQSLRSGYLPRESLGALWHQYRRFGRAKVAYWRATGDRPQARQWVLMAAPPVAGAIGVLLFALGSGPARAVLAGAAAAALVALEVAGTDEPPAGPGGHVVGAVSVLIVGGGWLAGVAEALARPPARVLESRGQPTDA